MEIRSKRKVIFLARQQAIVTVSRILLRVLMPNIMIGFDTTLSLLIQVNIVTMQRRALWPTIFKPVNTEVSPRGAVRWQTAGVPARLDTQATTVK